MSTNNKLMPIPFADKAGETYKYSIPNTNDTTYPNKATYENGFPAVTMTDIAAGGIPPFGQDFNGVLNDITTAIRYMQAGNYQLYNSDFATSIGGYSKGAVVLGSDNKLYESTIDSNTNDPISGAGWTLHLNYLPLTGGTLTGKLNGTDINATGAITIKGTAVLKVGDGGVATTALKVLPDFKSLSNNSGTYIAYGSKVPNLATPNAPSGTGNSKLTVTVRCDGTVSHYEVIENTAGSPKKWVGECYTSSGSLFIYWTEVVTTSNVSSLFENKLTDSGYQKLPNGLIMQWQNNFAPTGSNITLPISFPNKALTVIVCNSDRQGDAVDNAYGYVVDNSTVFIELKASSFNRTNQLYKVSYIAIGY